MLSVKSPHAGALKTSIAAMIATSRVLISIAYGANERLKVARVANARGRDSSRLDAGGSLGVARRLGPAPDSVDANADLGRRFGRARGECAAPGVTEDELDRNGDATCSAFGKQPPLESRPTPWPGQSATPPRSDIDRAAGAQIADQRRQVRIRELEPVHVDDGLYEAAREREIAEVVHVEERVDVNLVVDGGPRPAKLLKRIGPER